MKIFDFIGKLRKNGSDVLAKTDVVDNTTSTDTDLPLSANQGKVLKDGLYAHINNTNNPHIVTKEQLGLGNVDNTADADKTVGYAEQLATSEGVTERVPYLFRTAGGGVEVGDKEEDKIVGGTVAWNQLVQNGNFEDASNWVADAGVVLSISNNVGKVTAIATLTQAIKISSLQNIPTGHKVFGCLTVKAQTSGHYFGMSLNDTTLNKNTVVPSSTEMPTSWGTFAGITEIVDEVGSRIAITNATAMSVDDYFEIKNVQIIDLTQAFGSTIADYIYSLEQGTAGAGIAWFKNLFPKPYYAYNAGTLMSVNASSHNTIGFNQFDKSNAVANSRWRSSGPDSASGTSRSDYIPCLPNATYYFKNIHGQSSMSAIFWFDADKNYISADGITGSSPASGTKTAPANAHYIGINIPSGSVDACCVNLHSSRDGEYEPYVKHEYPLDSTLELRGIPKLDADNKLYYDGDTYESDGTVTRKYAVRDLGTLTWHLNSSHYFYATPPSSSSPKPYTTNLIMSEKSYTPNATTYTADKSIYVSAANAIWINDSAYSDAATFKTAMSGVYLVYELRTPTTETAEPFTNPQIVEKGGTEEYVVAEQSGVAIPAGHETFCPTDLKGKLEDAPSNPSEDGDYIVRRAGGVNTYFKLPDLPSADGIYSFTATVSSGTVTFSWEV